MEYLRLHVDDLISQNNLLELKLEQ
jgi:hypothetical protein